MGLLGQSLSEEWVIVLGEIDWLELWRELATMMKLRSGDWVSRYAIHARSLQVDKTLRAESSVRGQAGEKPDPLLDFILRNIDSRSTVLDVGAGAGRWAIPVARIARSVTAVEPSADMQDMLRQRITAAGLSNIQIVAATWQEAAVEPHDVVICAHAMNASPEFADFVHKMERHARQRCYIALHLPPYNGIINDLSLAIYGHRYDSPNAIVAYNALYAMGIYANVLVEEAIDLWENDTIEEAFARAKRHLRLESSTVHDGLIRSTLAHRLTLKDGRYVWPDGMRSVLLWWSPHDYSPVK
ncbi:MAG: class I SAM-dependent methyltransferase [Chloroflexi bacterium]|nr:class I SAM-dependent methyltransferase [Chloroflexota bacterium]